MRDAEAEQQLVAPHSAPDIPGAGVDRARAELSRTTSSGVERLTSRPQRLGVLPTWWWWWKFGHLPLRERSGLLAVSWGFLILLLAVPFALSGLGAPLWLKILGIAAQHVLALGLAERWFRRKIHARAALSRVKRVGRLPITSAADRAPRA